MSDPDRIANLRLKLIEERPLKEKDIELIHEALSYLYSVETRYDRDHICYDVQNQPTGIMIHVSQPDLETVLKDSTLRCKLIEHLANAADTFFAKRWE